MNTMKQNYDEQAARKDALAALERMTSAKSLDDIPKDDPNAFGRIERELFPKMLEFSDMQVADFFRGVRAKFKSSQKEVKKLEVAFEAHRQRIIQSMNAPHESSQAVKEKADERLRSPDFFTLLTNDFQKLGLVGETENATLSYLVTKSTRMKQNLHSMLFGASGGGKSLLVKTILSMLPNDAKMVVGSASTRSFDYLDPATSRGKVIVILEFEGAEQILDSLRTIITEGNSSRMVTVQDPATKQFGVQVSQGDHRFSLLSTTTRSHIQEETANRLFCLHIEQNREHFRKVGEVIRHRHTYEAKVSESEREEIRALHQAIHRALREVEVYIPFSDVIRFPFHKARHNRDLEKFLHLIEVIAFVRQFQKPLLQIKGLEYIEADVDDYAIAYDLVPFALAEAVQELTPPEESVLDLAVKYIRACTATSNQSQEGCHITTRTILELASQEGIDVGNQTRVGHLLSDLEFKRIMECVTGRKQGSRSKYVLALALDKSGGVTGIRPSLISQISAPDEIRRTLASQPRTFRVEDSTDPYKLDEKEGGDGQ